MHRRLQIMSVAVSAVTLFGAPATGRDDSSAALDARLNRAVVRTIREGVALFNHDNDATGCYRLYQGSLTGLGAFLADRPEWAKAVDDGLALAASKPTATESAFALRDVLNMLYEETKARMPSDAKPLWDRLGGQPAVEAVVADFVALAAADSEVDFFRNGKYELDEEGIEKLKRLLVELISSATGGPLEYTGRGMKESHAGMKITEAQFGALAGDLLAVLKKFKVPKAETDELIAIVASTKGDIVETP